MKLYRAYDDRRIAGVCGGLAKYLDWSSTKVRIVWVLATIFTVPHGGTGVVTRLALWFLMPKEAPPAPAFEPPPLQPWKRSE